MSLNSQEKVRCPECGALNDITLWQSVTASDSPDLKASLLSGNVNVMTCTQCGQRALVPTALLYHDEEKKLLFSFYPLNDEDKARDYLKDIRESSKQSGELEEYRDYVLRFISDYNSLMEKILIFDSGLNDKTIEIIKLMVLLQDEAKADKRTALFGKKYENGTIEIMVKDEDGSIFTSRAPYETYVAIHNELLRSGVKDVSYEWEVVDKAYAKRLLTGINN